jgi:hypothetical protein
MEEWRPFQTGEAMTAEMTPEDMRPPDVGMPWNYDKFYDEQTPLAAA